jgi:hypothetical protein
MRNKREVVTIRDGLKRGQVGDELFVEALEADFQ